MFSTCQHHTCALKSINPKEGAKPAAKFKSNLILFLSASSYISKFQGEKYKTSTYISKCRKQNHLINTLQFYKLLNASQTAVCFQRSLVSS